MNDLLRMWPIGLTLVLGLMGYAQLQTEVEVIKEDRFIMKEVMKSLPVIEYKVVEMAKLGERLEEFIKQQSRKDEKFMDMLTANFQMLSKKEQKER